AIREDGGEHLGGDEREHEREYEGALERRKAVTHAHGHRALDGRGRAQAAGLLQECGHVRAAAATQSIGVRIDAPAVRADGEPVLASHTTSSGRMRKLSETWRSSRSMRSPVAGKMCRSAMRLSAVRSAGKPSAQSRYSRCSPGWRPMPYSAARR